MYFENKTHIIISFLFIFFCCIQKIICFSKEIFISNDNTFAFNNDTSFELYDNLFEAFQNTTRKYENSTTQEDRFVFRLLPTQKSYLITDTEITIGEIFKYFRG